MKAIVEGIEMFLSQRNESFSSAPCEGGFEVLYSINGQPRRFAFCTHEQDAKDIEEALRSAHYWHRLE